MTYGGTLPEYPSRWASQLMSVPKLGMSVRLGLMRVLSMR